MTVGWSRYWTALAGYQFSAMGGSGSNSGTRWHDFASYAPQVALGPGVILVVSLLRLAYVRAGPVRWMLARLALRRIRRRSTSAAPTGRTTTCSRCRRWFCWSAVRGLRRSVGHLAVRACRRRACCVAPTLVWLVALIPLSRGRAPKPDPVRRTGRPRRPDRRLHRRANHGADRSHLRARVGGVPLLPGAAHRAATRTCGVSRSTRSPTALPRLRAMLATPDRPTLVIMDTPNPDTVDPSGGIAADLATYYHVDGDRRRRGDPAGQRMIARPADSAGRAALARLLRLGLLRDRRVPVRRRPLRPPERHRLEHSARPQRRDSSWCSGWSAWSPCARAWWYGRHLVGRGILTPRWVLVTAALWMLPMVFIPPLASRDMYAYACQGALFGLGTQSVPPTRSRRSRARGSTRCRSAGGSRRRRTGRCSSRCPRPAGEARISDRGDRRVPSARRRQRRRDGRRHDGAGPPRRRTG